MIRFLIRALQILLPLALYFLWLRYRKQKEAAISAEDAEAATRAEREITIAVIVLAVICVASFAALRLEGDHADPSKTYVPPHSENGQIVPGHFQ